MSLTPTLPTKSDIDEESRRIRRLRIVVNLSLSLIAQGDMPYEDAQEMLASAKRLAEDLFRDHFPGYPAMPAALMRHASASMRVSA